MRVLNLLKVVNETMVGYCKAKGVAQFFSLSLKPNVFGVWLAKGGRKRLNTTRIQLIIHSTRHRTNLTKTELDKVSTFQTCRLSKTTKSGCNLEKLTQKGQPESH